MTANQFRAALDRLGLSQVGAARLFGAGDRTARRWALDERAIPNTVAILLRLMLAGKITAEDVRQIAQMTVLANLRRRAPETQKSRRPPAGSRRDDFKPS